MAVCRLSESLLLREVGSVCRYGILNSACETSPGLALALAGSPSLDNDLATVTPPHRCTGLAPTAPSAVSNWPYISMHAGKGGKVKWRYVVNPARCGQRAGHPSLVMAQSYKPWMDLISLPSSVRNSQSVNTTPLTDTACSYGDSSGTHVHRGPLRDTGMATCYRGCSHMASSHGVKGHVTYSVSQPLEGQGSLTKYSAAPSPPPPQQQQGQSERELPTPAQLSVILLKLREELPAFFSGHHTYGMYCADLTFTNNLLPLSCTLRSRWSYRCFLASSRTLLRASYTRLNLDLLRITKDVDSGKIEARWRVRGRSLLRRKERVILDGYSEFRVSCEGCISHHHMDCLMPAQKEPSKVESVLSRPLQLLPKQPLSQPNST